MADEGGETLHPDGTVTVQFMETQPEHNHPGVVEEEAEPETSSAQSYAFNCNLCQDKFRDQFEFFEHLRTHYDGTKGNEPFLPLSPPLPTEKAEETPRSSDSSSTKLRQRLKIIKERRKSSGKVRFPLPSTTDTEPLKCSNVGCKEEFTSKKALSLHFISAHVPEKLTPNDPQDCRKESPRYGTRSALKTEAISPSKMAGDQEEVDNFMMEFKEEIDSEENSDETAEEFPDDDDEVYEPEEIPARDKQKGVSEKEKMKQDDILCPDCGEFFETLTKLKAHKKLNHSDEAQLKKSVATKSGRRSRGTALQCKECLKVFNHKNSLVYHMKGHAGERNYECTDCGKKFLTSSALNVHNRLHTGEKPYKCEHCQKPFRQWGDLAYHMVSLHSNVRAFVCEFCGKDFARKYSLTVHRRIHTLERDYTCDFCSKSFRAASYLQSHRRIHTGEKPHNCDVCGKPFRVKSDMRRHRLSHTRNNEKPRGRKEASKYPPGGASGSTHPRVPLTKTKASPQVLEVVQSSNHKVEQEPSVVVHNLVAVDESGQIIELEPEIAQQLRAGQVIQVPLVGSSSTRRLTIENADGSLITGDLESHHTLTQDEEELKGEEVEQEVSVEYLQHADIVISTDGNQDPTPGSLYVWPVFMS